MPWSKHNDAKARETETKTDPAAPPFDFDNYNLDEPEVVHVEDGQYERIQYAKIFQIKCRRQNLKIC
ncbi:unnamed protein product [Gongylonema pulchrum]|uniref:ATP-dependent DNA helicase n=1 Tax=Gongylonema pulchrum TaxID=637853 RepID=A0A183E425_9BILA|nr:unnamed protein product [Gongylonema pulchrum]